MRTKKLFHQSYGPHGAKVRVEERSNGTLRLRWWDANTQRNVYMPLPIGTVRRPGGKIDPQRALAAKTAALNAAALIASGQSPLTQQTHLIQIAPDHSKSVKQELTIYTALENFLALGARWDTECRQRSDSLGHSADICYALGPHLSAASVSEQTFRTLWKSLAERRAKGELRTIYVGRPRAATSDQARHRAKRVIRWGGPRHAEESVKLLVSALRWAKDHGLLEEAPTPPRGWKREFRNDWRRITRERLESNNDDGLRYSEEEIRAQFAVLDQADQRIHLALEIALEGRLGQVIQTYRSSLDLASPPHGELYVKDPAIFGEDNKRGVSILLSRGQRELFDRFTRIGSYLQPLETAYLAGRLKDYPLFPSGKIKWGLDPNRTHRPLSRSGLGKMLLRLEKLAGVAHVPGRLGYGFRRAAADVVEDLSSDPRVRASVTGAVAGAGNADVDDVLNSITGHTNNRSRRRYQNSRSHRVKLAAAKLRESVREHFTAPPQDTPNPTDSVQEN